jgi:hypothetical protein
MSPEVGVNARCKLLGEYVDDAFESEAAPAVAPGPGGESVRARLLGDFVDDAAAPPASAKPLRSFVVLLKQNREITVRGTGLKFIPAPAGSAELGSYAVLIQRAGNDETCVALFRAPELIGIFEGAAPNGS